jgi:Grx4 family monothiol glutaredoxin
MAALAAETDLGPLLREYSFKQVVVLAFVTGGVEACQQVMECLPVLAETQSLTYVVIDTARFPDLLATYKVTEVPTTVLVAGLMEVRRSVGGDTAILVDIATSLCESFPKALEEVHAKVGPNLDRIIKSDHVVVFIKGSPEQPKCKFTRKLVGLLDSAQTLYSHYDILQDDITREWLKRHSNWPTFPQVYVRGELIGGVDVVEQMINQGEFAELINKDLAELIRSHPIMLFMKGSPQEPQCGFSERMVLLLQKYGAQFGSFDILRSQSVRERLKVYSHWPTYPQLYVKGEMIGGIDITEQMDRDGELEAALKVD